MRGKDNGLPTCFVMLFSVLFFAPPAWSQPVAFVDHRGTAIRMQKTPERVVAPAPVNTEMIVAIGAGDFLAAVADPEAHARPTQRVMPNAVTRNRCLELGLDSETLH